MIGMLALVVLSPPKVDTHLGAHPYTFVVEYRTLGIDGKLTKREKLKATVTRAGDRLRWSEATMETAIKDGPYAQPVPQGPLNGFSYPVNPGDVMLTDSFFQGFPPYNFLLRNLVWDTHMFDVFVEDLPTLKPRKVRHLKPEKLNLNAASSFTNSDIQLSLLPEASVSGVKCARMKYFAPNNRVHAALPSPMEMNGKTTYWGEIWIAKSSGTILKGTLFEDVKGTVKNTPMGDLPVHVYREGLLSTNP
jgi:hypothetical protein